MSEIQGKSTEDKVTNNKETENDGCSNSTTGWGCFNFFIGIVASIAALIAGITNEKFSLGLGILTAIMLFVLIPVLGTIGALIGDSLRKVAHPDMMFTTGGMGSILKFKLFWAIGPQVIGSFIGCGVAYFIVGLVIVIIAKIFGLGIG